MTANQLTVASQDRDAPGAPWFVRFGDGGGEHRLFCFPYAGGSSSAFARWHRGLPEHVEVWAAELPGRARRLGEPVCTDLRSVVRDLRVAITPLLDRPVAFFGHSMGALLAYELAWALENAGQPRPDPLIVSGFPAPHLDLGTSHRAVELSADLTGRLREWGGTPPEVLADPELLALMLPALRADLAMCHDYRHEPREPLRCPLLAVGGRQDPETPVPDLMAWSAASTHWLGSRLYPGGHFFLRTAEPELLATLTDHLSH